MASASIILMSPSSPFWTFLRQFQFCPFGASKSIENVCCPLNALWPRSNIHYPNCHPPVIPYVTQPSTKASEKLFQTIATRDALFSQPHHHNDSKTGTDRSENAFRNSLPKIKNSRRSAFCAARRRRRIQTQCRPWARSRQHPPKSFKSFFLRGGIQVSTFLISIISSNNDSIICAIAKTPILGRRKDVYLKSQ